MDKAESQERSGESSVARLAPAVFTMGEGLDESHVLEAFSAYGIQVLLDMRPAKPSALPSRMPRRVLSRLCARAGVRHERVVADPEVCQNVSALRAAITHSGAPVVLLFTESDPRNGARRATCDSLAAIGWQVVHIGLRRGHILPTQHTEIFAHAGNVLVWPPPNTAALGIQELNWAPGVDTKLFEGGRYLVRLPWQTELLWIPNWLCAQEADELRRTILERISFQQPLLRFERGQRDIHVQQPRRSAWVSDCFNSQEHLAALKAAGKQLEDSVLEAHKLESWSHDLFACAEKTASANFNAMLLHSYDHGNHSMGFHSDTDVGLGDRSVIGSFSLGATRTFSVKSQMPWQGRRLELRIPMNHGSFLVMGPGFQGRWLHAVLKDPTVSESRINGTFRYYDLPEGSALCACGASRDQGGGL